MVVGNEELREKVENLIESLNDVKLAPSEDIKKMKESVFGSTGFWVTEAIPPNATSLSLDKRGTFGDSTWITFRGNMRGDSAEVFAAVDAKMKEIFGECDSIRKSLHLAHSLYRSAYRGACQMLFSSYLQWLDSTV